MQEAVRLERIPANSMLAADYTITHGSGSVLVWNTSEVSSSDRRAIDERIFGIMMLCRAHQGPWLATLVHLENSEAHSQQDISVTRRQDTITNSSNNVSNRRNGQTLGSITILKFQ